MLSRIAVPTLVVVGREDEFTPVRDAEFMIERIPAATLAVIEGAAHMPNLERQREFDAALCTFLKTLWTVEVVTTVVHDQRQLGAPCPPYVRGIGQRWRAGHGQPRIASTDRRRICRTAGRRGRRPTKSATMPSSAYAG
jgi:hypothetical protein